MALYPTMITDRLAKTDSGKPIAIGTEIEYRGHIPGGMVQVKLPDGDIVIVHPHIFKELR